jgi:heme exporter protein D
MNWSTFLDMGGYALYVWTSYGLMLVLLLMNGLLPYWRLRTSLKRQKRTLLGPRSRRP